MPDDAARAVVEAVDGPATDEVAKRLAGGRVAAIDRSRGSMRRWSVGVGGAPRVESFDRCETFLDRCFDRGELVEIGLRGLGESAVAFVCSGCSVGDDGPTAAIAHDESFVFEGAIGTADRVLGETQTCSEPRTGTRAVRTWARRVDNRTGVRYTVTSDFPDRPFTTDRSETT
jgi:hypothetical protein